MDKIRTTITIITICAIACLFQSCSFFEIQGPKPAYLNIDTLEFNYGPEFGSDKQDIKHVEVFFENFSVGFYELPVRIAVIPTKEKSNLSIFPAIDVNGFKKQIVRYDMMQKYSIDQKFEVGETYTVNPVFTYSDAVEIDYVENFENGNSFNFNLDQVDSTFSKRVTGDAATGNYAVKIESKTGEYIAVATEAVFKEWTSEAPKVFVEMDFKADEPFRLGLVDVSSGTDIKLPFITLNAKGTWEKIYLDVSKVIIDNKGTSYRLYVDFGGQGSFGEASLLLDNIKILHIQ